MFPFNFLILSLCLIFDVDKAQDSINRAESNKKTIREVQRFAESIT